jgi:putative transposase
MYCTKNPFKRQVLKMMNERDAIKKREGPKRAYFLGGNEKIGENWINSGDHPMKYAQLDTKYNDLEFVDDETGESLGIGSLTLLTLPFYGGVPIGRSILLEPPSYRSATLALRDAFERYGELPTFIDLDGGPEFNNVEFDKLCGVFGVSKDKGGPSDPREKPDAESRFRSSDVEFTHQLTGNTVPRTHGRAMSKDFDPRRTAVWTLPAFQDEVDHYLFTMLWDAHSAKLGTTPRLAFERDMLKAPDRKHRYILPEGTAEIAFFPDVKGLTREVVPGRGVWVEGYYYWSEEMRKPGVERTDVRVRYDPYNLYTVYAAIRGKWEPSVARFAPELRNVTERYRHLQVQVRRRLRKDHGKKRDAGHGRAMAERAVTIRDHEKLLKEQRRARAQRFTVGTKEGAPARLPKRSDLPKMDFTVLSGGAA